MPTDAKEILKMLFDASLKGTKNKDCQWCVVQFLEKAALGPFAPLGMLVSRNILQLMRNNKNLWIKSQT